MTERERAYALLERIERESLYATLALQNESGFVRTLVLGVLRWRSRLDFVIASLSDRPLRKLDPAVVGVLRIGIYQLLYMNVASHAAVAETVELAGRHASRARGFVNAVLRRATRESIPEPADLATKTAHPAWLIARWTEFYGAERAQRIAEANQELSTPDILVLGGDPPTGAIHSRLVGGVWKVAGSTADLDRNRFYPMDEGSAVVAATAAATAREVLDLAAAPGGKSLYLRHQGVDVISNDVSFARLIPLAGRGGKIVVSDGTRPPFSVPFDCVLLDAPCSATGTNRKNPELKWRLREEDLPAFSAQQAKLLAASATLTRRWCVYATCSLEREENDAVIADPHFAKRDITPFVPEGARGWVEEGVLRLTPESGADGFTVFLLERK
ncbi:MAG TPA: transcription antitermination factor NusB [Thermoanaerobaculia bacterium]|nr:transcription antitermination factor NusB [Thermoanaerobaculia bacterium]